MLAARWGMSSTGRGSAGNVISALASFFIPGLGQLLQGRLLPAGLFFLVPICGYALWFLIIPPIVGAVVHLWSILDAAMWKGR